MSYDGSGTYTPPSPEYPAVAGSLIKSADFNGIVLDIAAALSLALVRDGRAPMTGDLSLGTHKITNVVNGANPQDATTVLQVFTSPTVSNPIFTGTPTAPTAAPGTDTTQLATTAFVQHPLDLAMTGTPTAPTAAPGTSTTQVATTAFVQHPLDLAMTGVSTAPTAAPGTDTTQVATTAFVQHPDSPAMSGVPTAPTAAPGTSTTQVATTAFVQSTSGASLHSPNFTGVPTAPTAPNGTNTTQLATTAFAVQLAFQAALPAQILDGLAYTLRSQNGTAFWDLPPDVYTFETAGGF